MPGFTDQGKRYALPSPTLAPRAAGYLFNRRMMIQATCRGYTVAQFMQPEPAKYAHVPTLAGVSFMQPEQPYFAHHPGRFFYVRDNATGAVFSAPYEPVRTADRFEFSPGQSDIRWRTEHAGLVVELVLTLCPDEVVELWSATVINGSTEHRKVSLVPYFPVGYSSWMNLSAQYEQDLLGVVASCVAPYQKTADYFKRKHWKDRTYLIGDRRPVAWEASQERFEGEGGLHAPDGLRESELSCGDARYELPACVLQYALSLPSGGSETVRLLFGPAKDLEEIERLRHKMFTEGGFEQAASRYADYVASTPGCIIIETPDRHFDHFVNHWLGRQVFYHGDTNRLCTDPQTRNYLQDAMGMAYLQPQVTRQVLLHALSQQKPSGEMPDGILLFEGAELKYINQIPHTDHGVWLNVCLQAYLDETNDFAILDEELPFAEGPARASVYEHMSLGVEWLLQARDERNLSYIAQGDWCDPMNMVGYKGVGVSGWLTEAVSYALRLWEPICRQRGDERQAERLREERQMLNEAINRHLWDGNWYARGITDDGVRFGVSTDAEGRIFLNAQSWALLCGAADPHKRRKLLRSVDEQLETPYGPQLLAPAYTAMREDVGRVTQKFPGSAENGSVYNHAAAFYAAALYSIGDAERAFRVLRRFIPGPDEADVARRGQLPIYVPNYYRGAYHQFPRTAGRSSQLFNTGTAAWMYRLVVEGLFGLRGGPRGLLLDPRLPEHWQIARATRQFRGATIAVEIRRDSSVTSARARVDGEDVPELLLEDPQAGARYEVEILLPASRQPAA